MDIETINSNKKHYTKNLLVTVFVTATVVAFLPIKGGEPANLSYLSFGLMGLVGIYCAYILGCLLTSSRACALLLFLVLAPSFLLVINMLSVILAAIGQVFGIVHWNRISM